MARLTRITFEAAVPRMTTIAAVAEHSASSVKNCQGRRVESET
jgi:hypothetical protein